MAIQRESSFTNDKTTMKGGGQDVAVGNPGMMYDTDTHTNQSLSSPKRGSDVIAATQGSDETFSARSEFATDDYDIMNFQFDAPAIVDKTLFIADREMKLVSGTARIETAGGSGHTMTIKKSDSGTATSGGTAITSAQALTGITANTNYALTVTAANARISSGQSVGLDLAGTPGSAANLTITLVFRRVASPIRKLG